MFGNVPADSRKSNSAATSVLVSSNITSTKATSTLQNWIAPGYTYNSVIGYPQINFLGTLPTFPEFAYFNAMPNEFDARGSGGTGFESTNILRLPIGARICGAYLSNNGTEIILSEAPAPAPFNISIAAVDFLAPETNSKLLIYAPYEDVNAFGGITIGFNSPFGYSSNSILDPTQYSVPVSLDPLLTDSYSVAFTFNSTNIGQSIIDGSICAIISYIMPGNPLGKTVQPA